MRDLYVFFDEEDAKILIDRLNQDEEIAFIVHKGVYEGFNQWKAVPTVDSLSDGNHSLWHVPGEPLKTCGGYGSEQIITDPWNGWTGSLRWGNSARIYLNFNTQLHTQSAYYEIDKFSVFDAKRKAGGDQFLKVSNFRWEGVFGHTPREQTHQWWKRFKRWVGREAVMLRHRKYATIYWAFPSAFQKLKDSMGYSGVGNLNCALREAKLPKKASKIVLYEDAKPLPTDIVLGGHAKPRPTDVVLGSKHQQQQL